MAYPATSEIRNRSQSCQRMAGYLLETHNSGKILGTSERAWFSPPGGSVASHTPIVHGTPKSPCVTTKYRTQPSTLSRHLESRSTIHQTAPLLSAAYYRQTTWWLPSKYYERKPSQIWKLSTNISRQCFHHPISTQCFHRKVSNLEDHSPSRETLSKTSKFNTLAIQNEIFLKPQTFNSHSWKMPAKHQQFRRMGQKKTTLQWASTNHAER